MNIFDYVTAQAIGEYWNESSSKRIPYLGEELFPAKKRLGLDLAWIKGYKNLPVALKPSNFDAKAEIRDRIGLEKLEFEMPFFREGMKIKEQDRQELLKAQESNQSYYQMLLARIYDDNAQLISGALVQSERMRMQLLQGGKIHIASSSMVYEYNYDYYGEYTDNNYKELDGSAKWDDHEAGKPINDLMEAIQSVEEKQGTNITRAIMTRKTWSHLLQNKSIKMDMNVLQGKHIILTDSMLQQYLQGKLGLSVALYNKKFEDESGAEHLFYKDGYVTLLPDGALGSTWYGTTPEEADLMGGNTDAQVSVVNSGITVTTYREPQPVNINTVVSEIVLPSFERMHETFLLKVF